MTINEPAILIRLNNIVQVVYRSENSFNLQYSTLQFAGYKRVILYKKKAYPCFKM